MLDFGQGGVVGAESFFGIPYKYKVADGSKIAGSIAIGKNTVARTGSVMLGDHSYTGKLGDIEINPANAMTYNDGIYSTTLGAGAYNSGSLAAVTGALSIASGEDTQNTGATIYGSMNSIESATSNSKYSGVASSVLGFANRTQNANAALIWGTGNEVTNSVEKIGIDTDWNNVSVAEAQQKAIEAMQSSKYAGGSVMAIGGGNKADYATYSQLTGVQNKVTGTKAKAAKYDFVNGYQNTVTEASDVTVIGSKNEVTADGNKVIGDNHKVSGKNNVIFGSADKLTETTVNNAVVLGHNAKVTGEGGVALGVGSVADRANAVSVGSTGANRQIINVAAGEADTDAVNVSQLKKATANANKGWKLSTEGGTANQVASEATVNFSGKKDAGGHQNITVSNEGNNVKIELASELKNVTGVVNGNSRVTLGTGIAGITNGQESVIMMNGSTTINGVVGIDNTGKISGVANGEADKDAVNYGQLKDVKAEALKHSTVTNGDNIAVTETTNKDGGKEYKVALNNDIHLFGDNGAMVSISGSHGTIWTSGSVTAGSVVAGDVVMDSTTATVSGLGNKTTAYAGFATTGKAATEEQLKEVATEAGKHTTLSNGKNTTIEPTVKDGQTDYKVNVAGDLTDITSVANGGAKLAFNGAAGTVGIVNGKGASIFMMNDRTVVNNVVGIDKNGKITGVANGEADKDAVNYGQLKDVKETANKGWNLSTGKGEAVNVAPGETVDFSGDKNIKVSNNGKDVKVELEKNLQGIESISNGGVKLALNGAGGTAGLINGKGASVFLMNDSTVINGVVGIDKNGKITNVAAGTAATDAVNVSQLNKVATEAGKHTQVKAGTNVGVVPSETDGTNVYTVNADGTTVSGDSNVVVTAGAKDANNVTNYGVKLNKDLKGIESVSNGAAKLTLSSHPLFGATAELTNGKASVELKDSTTIINGKVEVRQDGSIGGVTAGRVDNDAVNLGQLNDVKAEALKHTTLSDGKNTTVEATVKDGQTDYKVNVAGDLTDITSVVNGGAKLALNGAAGYAGIVNGKGASVYLQDGYTKINNQVIIDQDGKISGVAAGTADTDAVNVSQLKKVSDTANAGWTLSTNGNATAGTKVTPGAFVDFSGDQNVSVSNKGTAVSVKLNNALKDIESISNGDAKLALNGAAGTAGIINGQGASVYMQGSTTVINSKVSVDKDGKISGVAAGKISADSTDAVNGSQLNAVATEAGKHSKVVNGNNTNVEETTVDGQKVYKVNLNNNVMVGDVNGKYVSISGTNGTVEATGAIATKDRVYADKGGKLADIDVTGNTISNGDAKLALNGAAGTAGIINGQGASVYMQGSTTVINSKVSVDKDGKISGVAAGAVTADSTDAVNGSQLHAVATEAGKHSKVVNGSNINVEEFDNDGQKIYKVNLNKDIMLGDLTGKYVNISGTNGTIETTGYIATKDRVYADKGAKLADIDVTGNKISNGASSIVLDGSNVKVNDKVTIDQNGKISGVAAGEISSTSTDAINGSQLKETNDRVTKNEQDIAQNKADIAALDNRVTQNEADIAANRADIDKNKADIAANRTDIDKNAADIAQNKTDIKNLDNRVTNVEELAKKHTTVTQGDNITVTEGLNADGGKEYNVALNKDINLDSVTTGQTVMNNDGLKVGKDVSVTATAVTAGKTSISDEGVKVGDKTYISDKGLNANDQKVTNVAAGELSTTSKDAVNGSQLYATNQEVANNTNRINKLGSRVNKVGAGAAALAALHPMDFDPDDKLTFSAGYGNYAGENAAAIGAYYRPDEKVMFSVAGTVGNGENMVNAGVSFALDRTNHVSNSRTALAREVIDLRGQLAVMGAKMAKMEKAFGMLDETKTKLFPDVPANHWAYEYIAKLAGNGYIEGYPDGNFGGDRLMTRYEFAAMLYRAIENGAALEEKIIKEFEPELGRIRVDRISGEDGDRDKIERVRVNDTKGERDHYGNKLAK